MDRMERYYERQIVVDLDSGVEESGGNEWDILLPDTGEDSPGKKAAMELDKYFRWTHGVYQPKMEPVKVLGAIDVNGQPQKPVYAFGPVLAGGRGKNLPSKKNHADYISGMGYYDAVNFLEIMHLTSFR